MILKDIIKYYQHGFCCSDEISSFSHMYEKYLVGTATLRMDPVMCDSISRDSNTNAGQ